MWTFQDISFCQFFLHPIPAKHSWTNSRLESGGMVGEIVTTVHTGFHWKGWAGKVEGVLLDNFHDAKSKGTKQRSGIPVGSSPSDLERCCPIWCAACICNMCVHLCVFLSGYLSLTTIFIFRIGFNETVSALWAQSVPQIRKSSHDLMIKGKDFKSGFLITDCQSPFLFYGSWKKSGLT